MSNDSTKSALEVMAGLGKSGASKDDSTDPGLVECPTCHGKGKVSEAVAAEEKSEDSSDMQIVGKKKKGGFTPGKKGVNPFAKND